MVSESYSLLSQLSFTFFDNPWLIQNFTRITEKNYWERNYTVCDRFKYKQRNSILNFYLKNIKIFFLGMFTDWLIDFYFDTVKLLYLYMYIRIP